MLGICQLLIYKLQAFYNIHQFILNYTISKQALSAHSHLKSSLIEHFVFRQSRSMIISYNEWTRKKESFYKKYSSSKYIVNLSLMVTYLKYKPLFYFNGTSYFKNVNNYFNANIYSYLETSGGQSSNLYLNAVHFFNDNANQTSLVA